MTERLLTARVVAQQLGLCTETVLAWVRDGKLPGYRLPGGAIRFREHDLDAWLQERATSRRGVVDHPSDAARTKRLSPAAVPSVSSTTITDEET